MLAKRAASQLRWDVNVYRRWFSFFLFTCLFTVPARTTTTPKTQHVQRQQAEVLFLSFSDPDLPDIDGLINEAEAQLLQNRSTPIHFTLEYLDPFFIAAPRARKTKELSFLEEKYRGQIFDLVIAIGEQAPEVGQQSLASLFPDVPLVFCIVSPAEPSKWTTAKPGRTGVIRNLNYLPTLQAALAQNPGTRQVVVVAGSSEFEKLEMQTARDQFRSYEPNVAFQYWMDLRLTDLKGRLSNVANDTIILFLDFKLDAEGERFVPARVLPSLHDAGNRPMYGTMASFIGRGVVGGSIADLRQVGHILGEDGARILNGEKPETIPVRTAEFQRNMFDWRELHRWQIAVDRVPGGSSVLYWEYSSWELYRRRIFGLSAALVIETLLIFLLLHSRATRRRVEASLRRKEAELSEAQQLARVGSWYWDPKTDAFSCSDAFLGLLASDSQTPPRSMTDLSRFLTPDSWARLNMCMQGGLQANKTCELELEALTADGNNLWLAVRCKPLRDRSGSVKHVQGTMQDITERKRAERARLAHSVIVESSDDSIICTDPDGTITSWNSGAERMFGFSEAEAIRQSIKILIPPELQEAEDIIMRRVLEGERVEHRETVRIRKDRKKIYVSLTASPIRDSADRIIGISRIARDITDSKNAEIELMKSEEKFSKAFRQGPMLLTLTNAKTQRYIDVNETFERLTGYKREEVIGRTPIELGVWIGPSERSKLVEELVAQGGIRDIEFDFRTKDGRVRAGNACAELIEIDGEPCVLAAAIDVTDRKRAEQALSESEKRFRLMADSAPVLMWMSDTDKLCTDFNNAWLKFTGRTMEQELGDGWTQNIHPDDLQRWLHGYTYAFEARKPFTLEYRLLRHDGQYRWILDKGAPRFLEDGQFAGYIGCCVDITEQKEAKAVQAELSGRLMRAHEDERAHIARELHDDINQRLALLANGIQGLEHALQSEGTPEALERLREFWQLTSEIATDLQRLSHQLHPSKLHYLGLAAATRGLCQEFSKVHSIEVDCSVRDLPGNLDESVSLSLFRTAQEALRNVAKHSHAHLVRVELMGEATYIRLRISDDGVGFNCEQVRNEQGLGLVSMQERLKLVGGQLSVWSRPSLGTQIEATVPLAVRHAKTA